MNFKKLMFELFDAWAKKWPWWLEEMIEDKHYAECEKSTREQAYWEITHRAYKLLEQKDLAAVKPKEWVEEWIQSKVAENA